jgi:hypothetical protein
LIAETERIDEAQWIVTRVGVHVPALRVHRT